MKNIHKVITPINNHYGLPVDPSKFDPVTYRFTLLESQIERMNSNLIKIIENQQRQIDNLEKRIIELKKPQHNKARTKRQRASEARGPEHTDHI